MKAGATLHLEEAQSTVSEMYAAGDDTDIAVTREGVFAKNAAASLAEQSEFAGVMVANPFILTNDCPAMKALFEIDAETVFASMEICWMEADVVAAVTEIRFVVEPEVSDTKAGAVRGWTNPVPFGQTFPLSIPYDPTVDVDAVLKHNAPTVVKDVVGALVVVQVGEE